MLRLVLFLFLISLSVSGQSKKKLPVAPKKPKTDSAASAVLSDTIDKGELKIREARKFAVYSKRYRTRKENRAKLCVQLVNPDTVFTYCHSDSLTRNPETSKIIFEKQDGDTNYVFVYTEAFSKMPDKPECDGGRETRLYFFRWNLKTNQAISRTRLINSCLRAYTNMTKQNILEWDGISPLNIEYLKTGTSFTGFVFNPDEYKKGFQGQDTEK
jgi:hypothetical protein